MTGSELLKTLWELREEADKKREESWVKFKEAILKLEDDNSEEYFQDYERHLAQREAFDKVIKIIAE